MHYLKQIAAAGMVLLSLPAQAADSKVRVEVGVLTCRLADRTNLVILSKSTFNCTFKHADGRQAELFTGRIDKIGADLTIKSDETLVWGVLAPSYGARISGMEGVYAGVGADVAVGAGIGVNALVGGLDKSFALQPVSVSGSEGVGVTVAVQHLRLTYQGQAK